MTKEMKTQALILGLIGYIIGSMLGAVICIVLADEAGLLHLLQHRGEFMAQLVGSGLLGTVNMAATVIYDVEEWGLTRATATHYVLALSAFLIANFTLGWFPLEIMIYVFIMFTIAYFIIWLVMFLRYKHEIRLMNQELRELLERDNGGEIS